ncbi:Mu transposase C-terminal domain-containing protein [Caballeronia sp. J97]|uniref:Mu transposase C-terminal domain-containing protein n=1 Tax=Caballeronia sp. J97 TaxID=2805429 RepID=UPI002AB110FB|nr:Mu transposase C-terminal domain-containing protein [Caballeronia sp. J97]
MLLRNDLFDAADQTRYRVLSIDPEGHRGWVMPVSGAGRWPEYRDFGVLTGHVSVKALRGSDAGQQPDLAFYSETARRRAYKAYDAIEPLINHSQIFVSSARGPLVEARAKELGISETTLYRYLRLYWRNGQSRLALVPDFDKIGRSTEKLTAGRGRRPKDGKYRTFQMTPADAKNVQTAIRKYYLDGEISTLAGAHFRMREEFYSYLDGNGTRYLRPDGECPSIFQFRHIARTKFTLTEILRKKRGSKEFDREHGAHLGSALEEAVGVGHIYEIDATIGDVFLVALEDRSTIIGKPTLYLIYDRWSRLVVGFYVGLENASWTGAMLAILSVAADKQALCARYGIPYDPEDWPADATFPEKWVGDRGEMNSNNSYRICDGMQSTVVNTQSLLPHRKGTVECGFRLLHASIADVTPGYEPPMNAIKRRQRRYYHDASLTLDEFTSIVIKHVIAHNRKVMKGYRLEPRHVLSGTPAVPLDLWNDDVARRSGALARYDYDFLRLQLLPKDKATVTQDGIKFRRLVFDCPSASELGWYVQAGRRGNFAVEVSYDPRSASSIIVYNPADRRQTFECKLAPVSKEFSGYSFAEVEYIFRRAELNNFENKASADQAKAELRQHIRLLSASAVAERKAASKGKSRSGRRADTAFARAAELAARRREDAAMPVIPESLPQNVIPLQTQMTTANPVHFDGGESQPTPGLELGATASPTGGKTSSPLRDMLRRKAQEKLNARNE